MLYQQLLSELEANADSKYRDFNRRLLKNDKLKVIGIKVPDLRKISKRFSSDDIENILYFPDEYYEVTFIKLTAVSRLEYGEFLKYIDKCVSLIDNWAVCDCFVPKCIEKHKDEFLPYIDKYLNTDGEFYQRFALTTLLQFYLEEKYLDYIFSAVVKAYTEKYYYVHMAAAWLIAEVLVKYYGRGVEFLYSASLNVKTHNKAIQKANESFRLSQERKNFLKEIKR